VNFHREKRSNQTHCSTTGPDAMLSRKRRGRGAVLPYRARSLLGSRESSSLGEMSGVDDEPGGGAGLATELRSAVTA